MMVRGPKGDGYSGADLAALVREAGVRALRRALGTMEEMESHLGHSSGGPGAVAVDAGERKDAERAVVLSEDFQTALGKVIPNVCKVGDDGMKRCARHLRVVALGGGRGRSAWRRKHSLYVKLSLAS